MLEANWVFDCNRMSVDRYLNSVLFKTRPIRLNSGSRDDRISHSLSTAVSTRYPSAMRNDQVTGNSPTFTQHLPNRRTNAVAVNAPTFVRAMPRPSRPATLPVPSSALQPAPASGMPSVTPAPSSRATLPMLQQLRHAIKFGGPEFNYQALKDQLRMQRTGDVRHAVFIAKNEFAFGMSDMDREKLLRTMQYDASNDVVDFSGYKSESFTNPEAVKALRGAASQWSAIQGNDISKIAINEAASFFRRDLVPLITEQNYQEAASALSEQPPGYRKPLPGTKAEKLVPSPLWSGDFSNPASNRATAAAQARQGISTLNASASSYPAATPVPWTTPDAAQPAPQQTYGSGTNKRSFSAVGSESASSSNGPTPAFKRSRPDDVQQAPSYSTPYVAQTTAPYQPPMPYTHPTTNQASSNDQADVFQAFYSDPSQSQPSSSWSASNGTTQSAAPHQPMPYMQPVHRQADPSHQANVQGSFQGSFHGPSQFQPSASWTAFNGMDGPSAPYYPMPYMQPAYPQGGANYPPYQGGAFQGPETNGPSFAGQPYPGVPGTSAPFDSWSMSDHEFNETMKFIDNLPPLVPATQGHTAVSALPVTAVSNPPAPVQFPIGATMAQQPMTTAYSAMPAVPALPPTGMPSNEPR